MSKSHSTEIIAILWLIAGLLTHSWWHWLFIALAIENILESCAFGYLELKSKITKGEQ